MPSASSSRCDWIDIAKKKFCELSGNTATAITRRSPGRSSVRMTRFFADYG